MGTNSSLNERIERLEQKQAGGEILLSASEEADISASEERTLADCIASWYGSLGLYHRPFQSVP